MKLDSVALTTSVLTTSLLSLGVSLQASAQSGFLRSMHDLEDPRGYCLDIPGFGPRMRLDAPINTHSCKYGLPGFDVDEIFELTDQKLRLVNFDRCLAADVMDAGTAVNSIACEDAHGWQVHADGRVTPAAAANLCLTLAAERVFVNSGIGTVPPYSSRAVSLEPCAHETAYRQRWRWSETDELSTYNANSLRSGIPMEVRQGNREIGTAVDPVATRAIYRHAARAFSAADVTVSAEIAYGPDDRHRLKVYEGNHRNPPGGAAPVIVFVHGGGFSAGNLDNLNHAATHFAGLGLIAVNITYPLAPEHNWPSGAESVAAAVDWVRANIGEYRGDPERVYIMGHSAGGNHVANYVFRPSVAGAAGVAGAILSSPALEMASSPPNEMFSAYFGANNRPRSELQVLNNIETGAVPVLITVAELDPDTFHSSTAQLFGRLIDDFDARPRLRQIPGHGHISYVSAIGTGDQLFTEEILDFILSAR